MCECSSQTTFVDEDRLLISLTKIVSYVIYNRRNTARSLVARLSDLLHAWWIYPHSLGYRRDYGSRETYPGSKPNRLTLYAWPQS